MYDANVYMAQGVQSWRSGKCVTLTFCVTEDCNLRCTYCYMVGKNEFHVMNYETAKKIVDYVLEDPYICSEDAVVWDFIGGEPLLEIDLIDKISDYIVAKMYATGHKWFDRYRFSFSSNGTLYHKEKVQAYFKKHEGHCSFTISLDGNKEKHDLSRKKIDGTGSYDDVIKNVPLWLRQFPGSSTKATFAHADLPYLKDSIIHLWNTGLSIATANLVYEDVWQKGDDVIFENQLMELADYVIENELWDKVSTSFFNATVGLPVTTEALNRNRCGAGYKTFAFDSEGFIYPCIRFLQMCFSPGHQKLTVGDIEHGINMDMLRSFISLDWKSQSPHDCNSCDVGLGCGWCVAHNYEASDKDTIFERTISLCNMHKANARANRYFWKRYSEATGKTSPLTTAKANSVGNIGLKHLYFITADNITPHCSYESRPESDVVMSEEILKKGLAYCTDNQLVPVFLGECDHGLNQADNMYFQINGADRDGATGTITVHDNQVYDGFEGGDATILLVSRNTLSNMADMAKALLVKSPRLNVFLQDLLSWQETDYALYKEQLETLSDYLIEQYEAGYEPALNLLTDAFDKTNEIDCSAGATTAALAPDGKFYICPAFYFNGMDSIGDLEHGIDLSQSKFCRRDASPLCTSCDVKICNRCMYLHKAGTRELAISPRIQCRISHLNHAVSQKLKKTLLEKQLIQPDDKPTYDDPFIDIYISNRGVLNAKYDV